LGSKIARIFFQNTGKYRGVQNERENVALTSIAGGSASSSKGLFITVNLAHRQGKPIAGYVKYCWLLMFESTFS
jgi:hypothetical protein